MAAATTETGIRRACEKAEDVLPEAVDEANTPRSLETHNSFAPFFSYATEVAHNAMVHAAVSECPTSAVHSEAGSPRPLQMEAVLQAALHQPAEDVPVSSRQEAALPVSEPRTPLTDVAQSVTHGLVEKLKSVESAQASAEQEGPRDEPYGKPSDKPPESLSMPSEGEKPADPTLPTAPLKPAGPAKPSETPAQPAEPAEQIETPEQPAEPAKPIETPAQPAEPAEQIETPEQPAEHIETPAPPHEAPTTEHTPAEPAEKPRHPAIEEPFQDLPDREPGTPVSVGAASNSLVCDLCASDIAHRTADFAVSAERARVQKAQLAQELQTPEQPAPEVPQPPHVLPERPQTPVSVDVASQSLACMSHAAEISNKAVDYAMASEAASEVMRPNTANSDPVDDVWREELRTPVSVGAESNSMAYDSYASDIAHRTMDCALSAQGAPTLPTPAQEVPATPDPQAGTPVSVGADSNSLACDSYAADIAQVTPSRRRLRRFSGRGQAETAALAALSCPWSSALGCSL